MEDARFNTLVDSQDWDNWVYTIDSMWTAERLASVAALNKKGGAKMTQFYNMVQFKQILANKDAFKQIMSDFFRDKYDSWVQSGYFEKDEAERTWYFDNKQKLSEYLLL